MKAGVIAHEPGYILNQVGTLDWQTRVVSELKHVPQCEFHGSIRNDAFHKTQPIRHMPKNLALIEKHGDFETYRDEETGEEFTYLVVSDALFELEGSTSVRLTFRKSESKELSSQIFQLRKFFSFLKSIPIEEIKQLINREASFDLGEYNIEEAERLVRAATELDLQVQEVQE